MTIARVIAGRSVDGIVTCQTATPVREAVGILAERRIGGLPVLEGRRVVGIFTERDVIYRLAADGPAMLDGTVGKVMTAPPITVTADTDVLAALALMTQRRFRHLPVVEGDEMIGFISIGDLVKFRIDRIEAEAEAMRTYIQSA
ncbi:MAG: CBS domain-containing protein [Novosphingobium sp.]|nr:CBS domain-containing protein [Novosphingobium sp.]